MLRFVDDPAMVSWWVSGRSSKRVERQPVA